MTNLLDSCLRVVARWWLPQSSRPPDKDEVRRILIYGNMGIGDLICLTPTLQVIRRFYSHAHISILVHLRSSQQILQDSGLVDEILVAPPGLGPTWKRFWWGIRNAFGRWDLVIAPRHGTSMGLMTLLSQARCRVGIVQYVDRWQAPWSYVYNVPVRVPHIEHRSRSDARLAEALGIRLPSTLQPVLHIPEAARRAAQQFLIGVGDMGSGPLVALGIGSNPDQWWKRWPLERFGQLARYLQRRWKGIIIGIGSAEEGQLMREELGMILPEECIAAGKLDLMATASLIEQAQLFVGNDSGPAHLAGAVETPAVVIYGPTDPRICHPMGNNHTLLYSDLDCQPCFFFEKLESAVPAQCERPCLTETTPEQVIKACEQQLTKWQS